MPSQPAPLSIAVPKLIYCKIFEKFQLDLGSLSAGEISLQIALNDTCVVKICLQSICDKVNVVLQFFFLL